MCWFRLLQGLKGKYVPVVPKYVFEKLAVQMVLVPVDGKVSNKICEYLLINRCWLRWLQGFLGKYANI